MMVTIAMIDAGSGDLVTQIIHEGEWVGDERKHEHERRREVGMEGGGSEATMVGGKQWDRQETGGHKDADSFSHPSFHNLPVTRNEKTRRRPSPCAPASSTPALVN
jgi:hypothetical protein